MEQDVRQARVCCSFRYVIPWENARQGTVEILREVAKSGLASFLAVLKAFGNVPSPGLMSFPEAWYYAGAGFSDQAGQKFRAVRPVGRDDDEFGGRLYPAKDAR